MVDSSAQLPDKPPHRTRLCLRCRTAFDSAWAGERICRRCKDSQAWRSGEALPERPRPKPASRFSWSTAVLVERAQQMAARGHW